MTLSSLNENGQVTLGEDGGRKKETPSRVGGVDVNSCTENDASKMDVAVSPRLCAYFTALGRDAGQLYEIAEEARKKGLDPEPQVNIPLARDVAARVEGLISSIYPLLAGSGLAEAIRELEDEFSKNDERICFHAAERVAREEFCKFESTEEALDAGVRVGVAYNTQGIVTAPLEGIARVKIKKRMDGGEYVAIYYAGPIRSAGGTANALSVLITDFLRSKFGYLSYDPLDNEVERFVTELEDYDSKITPLQFKVSANDIRTMVRHIPVEVSGDATEKLEVLSYKDLERVETNNIRSGVCLTLSCIYGKAFKLLKRVKGNLSGFELEHWKFLEQMMSKGKKEEKTSGSKGVEPSYKYMSELPGGRPVFSYPSRAGGFRLRYGRSRNTGFAACGIHPATMIVTDEFISVGTQLKIEYPGKATVAMPVDGIEGPIVRTKNGSVVRVTSIEQAREVRKDIDKVLFLGDLLVGFGEFATNGKKLLPAGWCEEWWDGLVRENNEEPTTPVSFSEALTISQRLKIPLHPRYTHFYSDLSRDQLSALARWLGTGTLERVPRANTDADEGTILNLMLKHDDAGKDALEIACIPHSVTNGEVFIEVEAEELLVTLGMLDGDRIDPSRLLGTLDELCDASALEVINAVSPVMIKPFAPSYIGTRMGRPEKAERRIMKGSPNLLFPVGRDDAGEKKQRSLIKAAQHKTVRVELGKRFCPECKEFTFLANCPTCGTLTEQRRVCARCGQVTKLDMHCEIPTKRSDFYHLPFKELIDAAAGNVGERVPAELKGVVGMSSRSKIPERMEKGILRAKHKVLVNKDGTIRFDGTDCPISHFTPIEIGTSVERLIELGYAEDIHGKPLEQDDQVVELLAQDILVSDFRDPDGKIASGADYCTQICNFVDDLLDKFYGMPRFYNISCREDLVGHLVITLAPHTSAAIMGRIIGFTPARVYYTHPLLIAARRRNADGDEDSISLALDALLNFSRSFLPDTQGARTMDAPLVLTLILNPSEIDDEVWDMDTSWGYNPAFYEMTYDYPEPKDAKKAHNIEQYADRIGKNSQYEGLGFNIRTTDVSAGPTITAYKFLGSMLEKVDAQLELGRKIRAVNADGVAGLVLGTHFLSDIKGNIRTFTRQKIRCITCNSKYRRVPLTGVCTRCGGKLILTVAPGSVSKYITPSIRIAENFEITPYLNQQLEVASRRLLSMFGKEKHQQVGLDAFLS